MLVFLLATLANAQATTDPVVYGSESILTTGVGSTQLTAVQPNFNWRTQNVTTLYVGGQVGDVSGVYSFDLASGELRLLASIGNDVVSALAFSGHAYDQQTLGDNSTELFVALAHSGDVRAVKVDKNGQVYVRDVSPDQRLPGVSTIAFARHNAQLHAATCASGSDALYEFHPWSGVRQSWTPIGAGYGCLEHIVFGDDNTLYAVAQQARSVLHIYSGAAVPLAQLPRDVFPVGVAFDSRWRLYVAANRATSNERQAEVYRVALNGDNGNASLTLVAAIGGATATSLAFSFDDRLFVVDAAHAALHEVLLDATFLADELALLAQGDRRAGVAPPTWRTRMLYGSAGLAVGGGVAALSTADGTEIALFADQYELKSLTARLFLDSWPLPAADNATSLTARNVHVRAAFAPTSTRDVFVSDSVSGVVAQLSPFAPLSGDFALRAVWPTQFAAPFGVAATADGSVLVADFAAGSIVQTDGFVAASSFDGPCGVALADANGKHLYVTEWLGGNLLAVDVDAHTRTTLLGGLDRPTGVAVNPLNGHVVVLASGSGLLFDVDPTGVALPRVIAALPAGLQPAATNGSLPLFEGVAFGDVVTPRDVNAPRSVALYVSLRADVSARRWLATQLRADAPAKPTTPGLVLHAAADGVVVVNLFHVDVPSFAVARGTTVRFIAQRLSAPVAARYDASGVRLLTSNDLDGFQSPFLYPSVSRDVFEWQRVPRQGPSSYAFTFASSGVYTYRDALQGATATITVYDPAYDNANSPRFAADATGAPTPAPTPAPVCRSAASVVCPPGTALNATTTADGCVVPPLRCLPLGRNTKPTLLPNSGAPAAPFVAPWRVHHGVVYEGPWASDKHVWAAWRAWAQAARADADPSLYWYSPQQQRRR